MSQEPDNLFHSQCGQDQFVDSFFRYGRRGTFIEIGAYDGVLHSNTYFLETQREWTGYCIEANPVIFKDLVRNRKACCINAAVSDVAADSQQFTIVHGFASAMSALTSHLDKARLNNYLGRYGGHADAAVLNTVTAQTLFARHGIMSTDYLSVDTDGNELEILTGIDWDRFSARIITVENINQSNELRTYLIKHGFVFFVKLGWDDVFLNRATFGQWTSSGALAKDHRGMIIGVPL